MFKFFNGRNADFKQMKAKLSRRYPLHSADLRQNTVSGLISVVLPVYNCEKYLPEAVASVLSQTYTNLELIIVDDGSTDGSGAIADEFMQKDERVRVIHQKNLKLPTALNNGFSVASGEFLTWTSADNRMFPVCLEILATELSHDRACDMVFGNMRLIDEDGNTLRGSGWYEKPPFSGNVILPDDTVWLNTVANNTIGAAFLYRAGVVPVLAEYSQYKFLLEDYDWFMRLNSLFNIKHCLYKKPLYEYRMHNGSLTSKDEELGITASRPALMELDKKRRQFYTKPLNYYLDGSDKEIESRLASLGHRVYSVSSAEKLSARVPKQILYINCGNISPTWDVPKGVPRFLVTTDPDPSAFGYDALLCKSAEKLAASRDWVCPATVDALVSLVYLRAKNDIMYEFEKNM